MIAYRKDVRFWGYRALGCRIHITIVYLDQFRGTDWIEILNGSKILRVIDLTASVWYMDRGRSRLLRKQDVIGSMSMSWMVASCPISQSALLSLMPSDQWPTYHLMFTWYVTSPRPPHVWYSPRPGFRCGVVVAHICIKSFLHTLS